MQEYLLILKTERESSKKERNLLSHVSFIVYSVTENKKTYECRPDKGLRVELDPGKIKCNLFPEIVPNLPERLEFVPKLPTIPQLLSGINQFLSEREREREVKYSGPTLLLWAQRTR